MNKTQESYGQLSPHSKIMSAVFFVSLTAIFLLSGSVYASSIRSMSDMNLNDIDGDAYADREDPFPSFENTDSDGDGYPNMVDPDAFNDLVTPALTTITSVSLGGPFNIHSGDDLNVTVSFNLDNMIDPWGQLFFDLGDDGSTDGFWVGDMSSGSVLITIPSSFMISSNWDLNTTGAYNFNIQINNSLAFAASSELVTVSTVPVPAAAWLFGSGLISLIGFGRHRTAYFYT